MKLFKYITALLCSLFVVSACAGVDSPEIYTMSVEPYRPVGEEDVRYAECTVTFGDEVSIAGQGAWFKGNNIVITEGGVYNISGNYNGGCIIVDTDGAVKLVFAGANISNPDGCALVSSADKLIISTEGTNAITGSDELGKAAIYSDGTLLIVGTGKLSVEGGVFSRSGIRFGRSVTTYCEMLQTDDGDFVPGTLNINP